MTGRVRGLRTMLGLPMADRGLLLQALLVLWGIRLSLWLLPLRTVRHLVSHATRESRGAGPERRLPVRRIAWAVMVARRFVPATTCLSQALAAQVMLTRSGHSVRLRIGVAKDQSGILEAHAWLENQGVVVFGGVAGFSRFTALPPLEATGS